MKRKWLVLDCNFLCYRAFYSRGGLAHEDIVVGTMYGFLMDVITLQDEFKTNNIIFCWDYGKGVRYDEYPTYKGQRRTKEEKETKTERRAKKQFRRQVKEIRRTVLRSLGIRNNFYQKGYESDDVMAQVCLSLPPKDKAVIVSADKDMFQCITKKVSCYNPTTKALTTHKQFVSKYGIQPKDWIGVKCIAGCTTDNVKGIPGVGEKTAIKYLLGDMNTKTATHQKIKRMEIATTLINLGLVKLPHIGTKEFKIRTKNKYTKKKWYSFLKQYGFENLRKTPFLLEAKDGKKKSRKK